MAKYKQAKKHASSAVTEITSPSRYGSHTSMVIEDFEDGTVKCHDEFGEYVTLKNRLDSGLADPARCGERRS